MLQSLLFLSAGTRLKIFEAMAMYRVIGSTPNRGEGLLVTPGKNVIFMDNPRDFARRVIELLREREKRENLGYSARRHGEGEHSRSAVSDVFSAALERVVHGYQDTGMSPNVPVTAGVS